MLHSQFSYVERWLRITREDTNEEKLEKLEAGLSEYTTRLGEAMALLASYLSISLEDRYAPLNTSLELQKEKTLYLRISVLKRRRSCPTYLSYSIHGLDVKVTGLAWPAWCLQRLGYPDRGPGAVERGAASEELGHRVSQAFALCA